MRFSIASYGPSVPKNHFMDMARCSLLHVTTLKDNFGYDKFLVHNILCIPITSDTQSIYAKFEHKRTTMTGQKKGKVAKKDEKYLYVDIYYSFIYLFNRNIFNSFKGLMGPRNHMGPKSRTVSEVQTFSFLFKISSVHKCS